MAIGIGDVAMYGIREAARVPTEIRNMRRPTANINDWAAKVDSGAARRAPFWCWSACALLILLGCVRAVVIDAETHKGAHCNVPMYIHLDGSAEFNFLFQVLLSRIYATCRCTVTAVERYDLSAQEFLDTPLASSRIILAVSSEMLLSEREAAVLRNDTRGRYVVLLHLGDETLLHTDEGEFGGVLQTMRNYYHRNLSEAALDYLSAQPGPPPPRVLWLPLGASKLVALPEALRTRRFRERPLLWSWAGSLLMKPERSDMVAALEGDARSGELLALGRLVKFDLFAGNDEAARGSANKWEYTLTMHDTQFMPIPSGISPEQYRLWEALEAGCIPIVLEREVQPRALLFPLKHLGFEHVAIPDWRSLPAKLWQLHEDVGARAGHYERMSLHNQHLWEGIKGRIAEHIAELVCKT